MKTIWKFPLIENDMKMPKGSKILTVQEQYGQPVIWAAVDPDEKEIEIRHFRIVTTGGGNYNEHDVYIGTVQFMAGGFVLHIFEIIQK